MPSSVSDQIPLIMKVVVEMAERQQGPLRILDCGIGNGRYGVLIRDTLDVFHQREHWRNTIDGIESFSAYITPVHRYVYSSIREANIVDVLPSMTDNEYDLALMIDVIEHFDRSRGDEVLHQLTRVAKVCVIATPQSFFEQGEVHGNAAEVHRSVWSEAAFSSFSSRVTSLSTIVQVIMVLGGPEQLHQSLRKWRLRQRIRALLPIKLGAYIFERRERRQGRRGAKATK